MLSEEICIVHVSFKNSFLPFTADRHRSVGTRMLCAAV